MDSATEEEKAGLEFDPAVIDLTETTIDEKVIQSDETWLILFYLPTCPHCQHVAPEFSDAAAELEGQVNFGTVNLFKEKSAGEDFGVDGVPSFGYWKSATDKTMENMKLASQKDMIAADAEMLEADDIADFALEILKKDSEEQSLA